MPARARPTVPHKGPLPHREHRANKGRVENFQVRHFQAMRRKQKLDEIVDEELDDEIEQHKNDP